MSELRGKNHYTVKIVQRRTQESFGNLTSARAMMKSKISSAVSTLTVAT
jgi:hypothetical protein